MRFCVICTSSIAMLLVASQKIIRKSFIKTAIFTLNYICKPTLLTFISWYRVRHEGLACLSADRRYKFALYRPL